MRLGFGLVAEDAVRGPRGVEEPACGCVLDCANGEAVGDAGNKVADALIAGKGRHGVAIGLIGRLAREVLHFVAGVRDLESGVPGIAAESYGGDFAGRAGLVSSAYFGWVWDGLGHAGFSDCRGYGFDDSIVRRWKLIICKKVRLRSQAINIPCHKRDFAILAA